VKINNKLLKRKNGNGEKIEDDKKDKILENRKEKNSLMY